MRNNYLPVLFFLSAVSLLQTNVGTLQGKVTDATTGFTATQCQCHHHAGRPAVVCLGTSANGNYMYEPVSEHLLM